ncbi:RNA polymerase recycling motor HelD [Clostridium cellulovorans]|uniref:DNA 3'-5' helicase n=1 Tax=Clostridium cellulovorans (strain ATCC 35296 / DSM 3052 / OCM 3 / 743B) TaxID=573061 RepID=D9SLT3_CLOC7|nr:RNA polymerase recycling motor HelD [Clostridium cellulovorans]ADL53720.1 UvrD/REP helicase [Clostridium cellulovorans 743B]
MSAIKHPDYTQEIEKLEYILDYMRNYNEGITKIKEKIDKEVNYGLTHYNSDNAEQFNDLIINTTLQDNLNQKVKNLSKSLSKPYFARVDFIEDKSAILQKFYIGKMSLLREKDNEPLIIDWRSPVANLYYEGRLGAASYDCFDGTIDGEIKLKRQYNIEAAKIEEMYDVDITTNDDFLQASLGSSKDNRLKDIVSTIQAEQNKVIRADMWKPLVVQGAAGGGKTTIALHRIAYLLYNHEDLLSPKNFMIIAPNRFFLSYISDVLPDLGVENVLQNTFEDLAMNIIGSKFKIKPPHEKLAYFIEKQENSSEEMIKEVKKISRFKSSLHFSNIIRRYIYELELDFLPKEDFKINNVVLISYNQLQRAFMKDYAYLPIMKRVNEIKKSLINILKQKKGTVIDEVEKDFDWQIDKVRRDMEDSPERRKKIIKLADERDALMEKIRKDSKTLIREYIDKIKVKTPLEYYKDLLNGSEVNKEYFHKYISETFTDKVIHHTNSVIEDGLLEVEDLAPLMFLRYHILGIEDALSVRHILIDEAQDFSLFQIYVLKCIINSNSFTILGDLSQGIHSYRGIQNWSDLEKYIFRDGDYSFLTLEQSYRTTVEIMDAANEVIKELASEELPLAKPVIRHGDQVTVNEMGTLKEIVADIKLKIEETTKEGFKSLAIICKTLEECKEMKGYLNKLKVKTELITGTEKEFSGGIVLIPSYLVKGLEFDVVIVANASKEFYKKDELDIKLLYIAMTRPLHRLYIYSQGDKTELL